LKNIHNVTTIFYKLTQQIKYMTLKEYLTKYRIGVGEFADRCDLTGSCMWHYLAGRRRPSKKTAEVIQKESDGLVTIKDLRGNEKR
jgi:predicted transcriptional regulator